jgi:predicted unusual protein kinase regulating ubiquinone biosynthesis (AarF/ABC1/UbiB family)
MSTKERLNRIKSTALSRGLALAKVSVSAGARAATHAMGNVFASESEKAERFKEMMISQMGLLSRELGQLKGSVMKVGQMLSMYGEQFLPPEANAVLKSLQSQSPPLAWKAVEKVIQKQLSPEVLAQLEIDPEPIASASLGQVHRAKRKSDGRLFAIKIQYPGVDRAIEGDLKTLRSILSISKLIPKGPKYDELFEEVRTMLHQEVDYARELLTTQEFQKALADDPRYIVPETFPEFSTGRILTTSFEDGVAVDSPEVLGLSQERRNAIGCLALDLYFRELFQLQAVQTDPHFGNYRVRLGQNGQPDQLILFDFGAVRKLEKPFLDPYLEVVRGAHLRDRARIVQGAQKLGFLRPEDTEEQLAIFIELCYLVAEPFFTPTTPGVPKEFFDPDGAYQYGESDLPKRAARKGGQYAFAFKLRTPPREIIFLDRKLGGLFIFLSVLKVRLRGRDVIAKYLEG